MAVLEIKSLPTVAHFGCGHLGIGAVLPFLIHKYGATHRIVAFQRRSKRWEDVPNGVVLPLRTTAGDFMPFRTVVIEGEDDGSERLTDSVSKNDDKRLLVLTPDLFKCHQLLESLRSMCPSDIVISCSLAGGQVELVQLLKVFQRWKEALVFENRAAPEWEDFDHVQGKKWHHVLVDRICWHLEEFSSKKGRHFFLCHCEDAANTRFFWPSTADIPDNPSDNAVPNTIPGEVIKFDENWDRLCTEQFKVEELDWQRLRKRALVNAPHAITALLCYRLLGSRKMDYKEQYLAPLQQMLRVEHPEWHVATDHYLRLQAIRVAWQHRKGDFSNEKIHSDYLACYVIAKMAEKRFFATNDRLDRLMSRDNIGKELAKFEEHILEPITFYEQEWKHLHKKWIYGRPNHNDIIALRGFLTETFLEATRWLTVNR